MTTPTVEADEGFPIPIDGLLGAMFEMLKERGKAREIAIIQRANVNAYRSAYDNWNGGTSEWSITLSIDIPLFSRLSDADREVSTRILGTIANKFFEDFSNDHFGGIAIVPAPVPNKRWREDAAEYLSGAGVSNQGRVRSDNLASRECDGLLFRSEAEINLYRALKALGVTFAPLPVFLRGGTSYARLEPDFVVLKDGVVMVIEVDGDTYHREVPADAHARLAPLDHEGAKIERVRASECDTPERAKACAARMIQILDKRIGQVRLLPQS